MRSEAELLAAHLDRSAGVVFELARPLGRTQDPRQGRQSQPVCHEHAMLTDVILQLLTLLGPEAESAVQRRFLRHTSLAYGQCTCLSVQAMSAVFSSTIGRRIKSQSEIRAAMRIPRISERPSFTTARSSMNCWKWAGGTSGRTKKKREGLHNGSSGKTSFDGRFSWET